MFLSVATREYTIINDNFPMLLILVDDIKKTTRKKKVVSIIIIEIITIISLFRNYSLNYYKHCFPKKIILNIGHHDLEEQFLNIYKYINSTNTFSNKF